MSDELNPIKQDIIENISEGGVEPGSQTHNIREHFQILCQQTANAKSVQNNDIEK